MSVEDNKKAVIRWYEAMNTRDSGVLDMLVEEIYASEYILHDPGLPDFGKGPAAVKKFVNSIVQNFFFIVVEDVIGEMDRVACRFMIHSTNASTSKPEITNVICISRFLGGKIVEEWELAVQIPTPVEI